MRGLQARVFPAAAILSAVRVFGRERISRQWPRYLAELRNSPSACSRIRASLLDSRCRVGGGATHDDQYRRDRTDSGCAAARHAARGGISADERRDLPSTVSAERFRSETRGEGE